MSVLRKLLLGIVLAITVGIAIAEPVDINVASAGEISKALTGIGPTKAAAIVEYRKAHGPFATPMDLTKVKGIGKKTVEKNLKDIQVTTKTAAQ